MSVGLLVNGPYALITTAVSTELGTHQSLRGSARALATVTAIIDGTGSIGNVVTHLSLNIKQEDLFDGWNAGAAVGPLIAGTVSDYGWDNVFYMLMVADVIALVVCPFLPSIFFFKQILNQPPITGQTKVFSAFSYCLAWSNTKLSGSASDDGRCALSESVWPNFCSLMADGQRSRPRHYLTFGLVYSSFVLYQKRKFMIGFIPSLPRKIIKKIINVCSLSELFRWIGLFWSALHPFMLGLPFYSL